MFRRSVWAEVGGYRHRDRLRGLGLLDRRHRARLHRRQGARRALVLPQARQRRLRPAHPARPGDQGPDRPQASPASTTTASASGRGHPRGRPAGAGRRDAAGRDPALPRGATRGRGHGPDRRAFPIRSVCLITKDYPPAVPGGIPRAVQMQAHCLAAAGVEVHVITSSATGRRGGARGRRRRRPRDPRACDRRSRRAALPRDPHLELRRRGQVRRAGRHRALRHRRGARLPRRGAAPRPAPRDGARRVAALHDEGRVGRASPATSATRPTTPGTPWRWPRWSAPTSCSLPASCSSTPPPSSSVTGCGPRELMPLLFDAGQFPAQRRPRDRRADPRALLRPARGPQEPGAGAPRDRRGARRRAWTSG